MVKKKGGELSARALKSILTSRHKKRDESRQAARDEASEESASKLGSLATDGSTHPFLPPVFWRAVRPNSLGVGGGVHEGERGKEGALRL